LTNHCNKLQDGKAVAYEALFAICFHITLTTREKTLFHSPRRDHEAKAFYFFDVEKY